MKEHLPMVRAFVVKFQDKDKIPLTLKQYSFSSGCVSRLEVEREILRKVLAGALFFEYSCTSCFILR